MFRTVIGTIVLTGSWSNGMEPPNPFGGGSKTTSMAPVTGGAIGTTERPKKSKRRKGMTTGASVETTTAAGSCEFVHVQDVVAMDV